MSKTQNIENIDKNFATKKVATNKDIVYYDIPTAPFDLYGVFYDSTQKQFLRMPSTVASRVSEGVSWLNRYTSGGRLRFSTNSSRIIIKVTYEQVERLPHMTLFGQAGFALTDDDSDKKDMKGKFFPQFNCDDGFSAEAEINAGEDMRSYVLYFPLYGEVKTLKIGLDKGSKVASGKKYRDVKPILYYGSSITQGGCASRPDTCYQSYISKWNNIDYINLGFSGNGKAEPVMREYLSGIDCSLFVCDYDHNAPDVKYLKDTHYPLYKEFRQTHPDTPILFITKPDYKNDGIDEVRAKVIKKTYLTAKANNDQNVYFLHGKTLFGSVDRDACMVDTCHPNDLGFYRMAKAIYKKMKTISPDFK